MPKLTPKQVAFCQEYLVDLNATQAGVRAGYSEKTAAEIGHENLRKPQVWRCIQEFMQERAQATEISAKTVVKEIALIAFDPTRAVSERLRGLELLGKHLGLFSERHS